MKTLLIALTIFALAATPALASQTGKTQKHRAAKHHVAAAHKKHVAKKFAHHTARRHKATV